MRVIQSNQKEHYGKCLKCGARLAVTCADVKIGWFNAYIICPVCNRKLPINDNDLYRFGLYREEY